MKISLSAVELDIVLATFHKLMQYPSSIITTIFYNQVFHNKPDLRVLFQDDLTAQKYAFWGMLQTLALSSHDPEAVVVLSRLLGERHKHFALSEFDHLVTHDALLHTFATLLQEEWGEQEIQTWSKLYHMIAQEMQQERPTQHPNPSSENPQIHQLYKLFYKQTVELTRVSDELFFTRQRLQQTELQNDEIIELIVHNIKNPVVGIQHISESLEFLLQTSDICQFQDRLNTSVQMIHKTTENILNLITKIRNIHKLEQKKSSLFTIPINLSVLLHHSLHDFQKRSFEKIIHFHTDLGDNLMILADPGAICEIFIQLINNAVHYSPDGSSIIIVVKEIDEHRTVRCSVKDEGPGIHPEILNTIFTATERRFLDDDHPSAQPLGLLTVKTLTEAMKGTVWCETTPDHGTEFFVEFPVYEPSHYIVQ